MGLQQCALRLTMLNLELIVEAMKNTINYLPSNFSFSFPSSVTHSLYSLFLSTSFLPSSLPSFLFPIPPYFHSSFLPSFPPFLSPSLKDGVLCQPLLAVGPHLLQTCGRCLSLCEFIYALILLISRVLFPCVFHVFCLLLLSLLFCRVP